MKRLIANEVKIGFIGLGNMGSRIASRAQGSWPRPSKNSRRPVSTLACGSLGA
jgi:hypothetical protein